MLLISKIDTTAGKANSGDVPRVGRRNASPLDLIGRSLGAGLANATVLRTTAIEVFPSDVSWPGSAMSRGAPGRMPASASDFSLPGDFESVDELDAEVPHTAFELRMATQQLHGSRGPRGMTPGTSRRSLSDPKRK